MLQGGPPSEQGIAQLPSHMQNCQASYTAIEQSQSILKSFKHGEAVTQSKQMPPVALEASASQLDAPCPVFAPVVCPVVCPLPPAPPSQRAKPPHASGVQTDRIRRRFLKPVRMIELVSCHIESLTVTGSAVVCSKRCWRARDGIQSAGWWLGVNRQLGGESALYAGRASPRAT